MLELSLVSFDVRLTFFPKLQKQAQLTWTAIILHRISLVISTAAERLSVNSSLKLQKNSLLLQCPAYVTPCSRSGLRWPQESTSLYDPHHPRCGWTYKCVDRSLLWLGLWGKILLVGPDLIGWALKHTNYGQDSTWEGGGSLCLALKIWKCQLEREAGGKGREPPLRPEINPPANTPARKCPQANNQ